MAAVSRSAPVIGVTLDVCAPGGYSPRSSWYALRTEYLSALQSWGGCAFLMPYDHAHLADALGLCDGLLVPGGDFDPDPALYGQAQHPSVTLKPDRTRFEYACLKYALERDMPIFGICGGMQLLNVVRGGSLIQDIPSFRPHAQQHQSLQGQPCPPHKIQIHKGSKLHQLTLAEEACVNSSHHQAVDRLGQGLVASACTEDGIIEAIEDPTKDFCIGTQWHPEYVQSQMEHTLFKAFIQAAARYQASKA